MGSRTMHLAIAELLYKKMKNLDRETFFIGMLLPDMIENKEDEKHRLVHFIEDVPPNKMGHHFNLFYQNYMQEIKKEDLYLGYYLHLIQDSIFKYYYQQKWGIPPANTMEFRQKIYQDYEVLNEILIPKYQLKPIESSLQEIEIKGIGKFLIKEGLELLQQDFGKNSKKKKLQYLQEEQIEFYIQESVKTCFPILEQIKQNIFKQLPLEENYFWTRT